MVRTLTVGALAYVALVLLLRFTGKRTLSKWNAFDLIVTIALGSALASAVLSKETSLSQGVTGFTLLVLLQMVITWLSVRLRWFQRVVKSTPVLLLYRGELRRDALRHERVTDGEVRAAVRNHGVARLEDVHAVVLETDGSFSVIDETDGHASALDDVEGYGDAGAA